MQTLEGLSDGDNYHREKRHVSPKVTSWSARTSGDISCIRPAKCDKSKKGPSVGGRSREEDIGADPHTHLSATSIHEKGWPDREATGWAKKSNIVKKK